jgi:hypothetical protein
MKREDDEIFSRRNLASLTAILTVAAAVWFVGLDWASVWEDEVTYMDLVRTDGPLALLRELPKRGAGGSPLYLLLLQAWLSVVGDSIVAAWIPSALCGTLAGAQLDAKRCHADSSPPRQPKIVDRSDASMFRLR